MLFSFCFPFRFIWVFDNVEDEGEENMGNDCIQSGREEERYYLRNMRIKPSGVPPDSTTFEEEKIIKQLRRFRPMSVYLAKISKKASMFF